MASDPRLNSRQRKLQGLLGSAQAGGHGAVTGGSGGAGAGAMSGSGATTAGAGMPKLNTNMSGAADGATQLNKAVPKVTTGAGGMAVRGAGAPGATAVARPGSQWNGRAPDAELQGRQIATTDMSGNQQQARRGLLTQDAPGTVTGGPGGGTGAMPTGAAGAPRAAGAPGAAREEGAPSGVPVDDYQMRHIPEAQREAASGVGEGEDIQGVSGRLSTLLDDDSPYLARARTRAKQQANRRGLLSSSIAVGAGETAAIDAALPIAQGDAELAARERQMRSNEYTQAREHRIQQLMQERGFDFTAAQNQADRELSEDLAADDHALRERMQLRGIESDQFMQQRGIDSSQLMQQRDHRVQQLMQERGLSHDEAQNQANRELQDMMQQRGIDSSQLMQQRDHRVQQLMQEKGLSHDAAQNQANRELQDMMQQRGIDSSQLMQQRDHRVQQLMQEKGLTHDAAQRQADRELQDMMQQRGIASTEKIEEARRNLQELMQKRDLDVRQIMQDKGLTHDAAQRQADRTHQAGIAAAQRALQASMQAAQISASKSMQASQFQFAGTQAALDREAQQIAQDKGISHAEAMQEASINAANQRAIDSTQQQIDRDYQNALVTIAANTQIPVEERRNLETHVAYLRDSRKDAVNQVYNTDVKWESTRQPVNTETQA